MCSINVFCCSLTLTFSPSFLTGLNSPHFILLASSTPQFIVGRRPSVLYACVHIYYMHVATTCRPLC